MRENVKSCRISNIQCLVSHKVVDRACHVTIHSKLRPQPIKCSFKNLKPDFHFETYLPLLQIYLIKVSETSSKFVSQPVASIAKHAHDSWVEAYREGLFYQVPSRIISYIQGSQNLQTLAVSFSEEADAILFSVGGSSVTVPVCALLKGIELHKLNADCFDDELYSIKNKHKLITHVVCKYVKKFL